MNTYKITTPREEYELEAKDKKKLRKLILEKEGINFDKVSDEDSASSTLGKWIFLEQDDEEWAKVTIGETKYELEDFGCTITCISMLTYWYGQYLTPAELAKKLTFNSEGAIIWSSINGVCPFKFVYRYYTRDLAKIKEILASEDDACIARVSLGKGYHWLAIIGYDSKNGLIAADPLDGSQCFIEQKYGTINGFAQFTRV